MPISAVQQSDPVIHTYIYSSSYIIFHHGLSQETRYSSLCCTVGHHCTSIINVIVSTNPKLLIHPTSTYLGKITSCTVILMKHMVLKVGGCQICWHTIVPSIFLWFFFFGISAVSAEISPFFILNFVYLGFFSSW